MNKNERNNFSLLELLKNFEFKSTVYAGVDRFVNFGQKFVQKNIIVIILDTRLIWYLNLN